MSSEKIEEWRNLDSELRSAQTRISGFFKSQSNLGSTIHSQLGEIAAAQKAMSESIVAFTKENHLGDIVRQIQQQQEEFSKMYRLGDVVRQLQEHQEEFSKKYQLSGLADILESHALKYQAFEWKVEFQKIEFEFGSAFEKFHSQIADIAAGFNAQFKRHFEIGDAVKNALKDLPANVRVSLVVLGRHGWFMDDAMSFPEIFDLAKSLQEGKTQEVDDALCQYFESRLDAIKEKVTRLLDPLPRSDVIEAFDDHRRGSYRKAIVMLLLTSDGLCEKVTNYSFFRRIPVPNTKGQNRPATAKYVDQFEENSFRSAALEPLKHVLPINKSGDERIPGEATQLNRHVVMHGEQSDYGTRVNSLRAVSFLNYILDNLVEDYSSEN